MSGRPELLPHLLGHPPAADDDDGFGQGIVDQIRHFWRLRRLRRQAVLWREPRRDEQDRILADPFLGRFADTVTALAWAEDAACVVLERIWHGFPDPPRHALLAMRDGSIRIAGDFHDWPQNWRIEQADGG